MPAVPRASQIASRNAAVGQARGLGIDTQGLRELRRDLKRLEPEVAKELRVSIREAVKPVHAEGRSNAPRLSGALAASLRIGVTMKGASISSRLPYAGVQHWGGSTGKGHKPRSPWSGSVIVEPSLFLSKALEAHEERLVDEIGDAVEAAAKKVGWN
jgi:phage gpG-like protein